MTRVVCRFASALVIVTALAATARAQDRRPPTLDDMLDLVQVSSPQISPDGSRVIYTRSEIKAWKDNKRVSSVWIADADGKNAYQFLGTNKDQTPRWSPDGALVAFLSTRDAPGGEGDREAISQIWLIRVSGGEAWKLTSHKTSIRSFEWVPDATALVFVSPEGKTDEQMAAEKAGDDAIFVDEGPNGQSASSWSNMWIVTVADQKERQLTTGKLIVGDFSASPDGRSVALTYRTENSRNGQHRSEVALLDVATGARRDLTANDAPEGDLRWSPDGSLVSFTAPHDRTWELAEPKLWTVPVAGGPPRRMSDAFTGDIRSYYWGPDGSAIFFAGVQRGRSGLFRLELASGRIRTVAAGDWSADLDSVTRDRSRGAGVLSSPTAPGDVQVFDLATGTPSRVTDVNAHIATLALAQFRSVTWKSRDGLEIEGLLWLPAEYRSGRLPLLASVHGGPAGVWSASFRSLNHVYAGLGWAVLEPNVRGSSSYGDALLRGNMQDIGGGDYWDLMTGVDFLIDQGIADADRLAVRGWSYGGILGGWTITQTDRFKAASVGAMVSDWTSEYAMGFNYDVRRWYIGGTPWDNPQGFREKSSYTHIARVKTPTLVIHGERDTTDSIGQSMMFYQGLKDRGVPVRFIRFPREPHGFREPHHQRIRDAEEIGWLMKHARGMEWTAPPRAPDEKTDKKTTTASGPSSPTPTRTDGRARRRP